MRLRSVEFRRLVREAVEGLPEEFLARLENCAVVAQEWPTREQGGWGEGGGRYHLLGLYEGVPLTERESGGPLLPDRITVFQRPIEARCGSREQVIDEVRRTVMHEVGHAFGIDERRLRELGLE